MDNNNISLDFFNVELSKSDQEKEMKAKEAIEKEKKKLEAIKINKQKREHAKLIHFVEFFKPIIANNGLSHDDNQLITQECIIQLKNHMSRFK